ncbi:MAG TPA: SEC-C metal-binding domain-containing protein [Vicinamibacterales bacterium]
MSSRPGRNEPCSCGSGQKYKRCCLPREEAARAEALRQQTLLDDDTFEGDEFEDDGWDAVEGDVAPFDIAAVSSVRYTRGFASTMKEIEQGDGLHVIEWVAPAIPSSLLELFADEEIEALDGPWGDETVANPIQFDLIEVDTPRDGLVIEVFNRAVLLLHDNTELTRSIHRICVGLDRLAGGEAVAVVPPGVPSPDTVDPVGSVSVAEEAVDFAALRKTHGRQSGICQLCHLEITRSNAGKHFASCAPAHDEGKGTLQTLFRLRVTSPGLPAYWLELEVRDDARLTSLDQFLRDLWLECCGHLSQFGIGTEEYASQPADFGLARLGSPQRTMASPLSKALTFCDGRFSYEYDFGSTTVLQLDVKGERTGRIGRQAVRLLARNTPPVWPCAVCGEPATRIDVEAYGYGYLCDRHASGREALLPVVNSPRTGVCAYARDTC